MGEGGRELVGVGRDEGRVRREGTGGGREGEREGTGGGEKKGGMGGWMDGRVG